MVLQALRPHIFFFVPVRAKALALIISSMRGIEWYQNFEFGTPTDSII
jgi:hypothetical protein